MSDSKSGFYINIKYKDHVESQNFKMEKGDDAICLYEKNQDNAIMVVEPLSKTFSIDNSSHRFDAISKNDVIIFRGVKNVSAEYNSDFVVTIDTEKGKQTYKISHNALSVKNGKSFQPVVSFEHPLDVTLPESLPSQIQNNSINMSTFPAQMTQMLIEDYGYSYLKLENGMTILKSPDGKIIFPDGSKLATSTLTDIVKAPSGLVLRFLPSMEMKKMKEHRVKKGINITEKDANALNQFMGKNQSLDDIPTLTSDSSYVKIKKSSSASRLGKDQKEKQKDEEPIYNVAFNDNNDKKYNVDIDQMSKDSINKDTVDTYENSSQTNILDNISTTNDKVDSKITDYVTTEGVDSNDVLKDSDSSLGIRSNDAQNQTNDETQEEQANQAEATQKDAELKKQNDDNSDPGNNAPASSSTERVQTQQKDKKDDGVENGNIKASSEQTPTDEQNAPAPSDKSDKDKSDKDKKEAIKQNDENQKKTMDEKKFNMFHKGLRLILLVAAANFFMAGFMLANPLFAFLAIVCITGMAASAWAQNAKFLFSSVFSIFKDIYDYFKAKHAIKELTKKEEKKLNKLLEKQSNGLSKRQQKKLNALKEKAEIAKTKTLSKRKTRKMNKLLSKQSEGLSKREQRKLNSLLKEKEKITSLSKRKTKKMNILVNKQANGLSKREQDKLEMLQTRKEHDMSYTEYKQFKKNDAPSMFSLNQYKATAQKQEDAFRLAKAQKLAEIDKEIMYRNKYLDFGKKAIPEQTREAIKEDTKRLMAYRENVNQLENISQTSNREKISNIEKSLIEKPTNWLNEDLNIDETSFEKMAESMGIEQPSLEIDNQTLKKSEEELIRRVEQLSQNEEQSQNQQEDKTSEINDAQQNDDVIEQNLPQIKHDDETLTR